MVGLIIYQLYIDSASSPYLFGFNQDIVLLTGCLKIQEALLFLHMNFDKEKGRNSSTSDIAPQYYDEVLHEPPKEDSLHRGLRARQISMIAVHVSVLGTSKFQ